MSYCVPHDVESYYMNKKFKCGDYVESSEIQMFIDQEAAVIDGRLKTRYSLPISSTDEGDLMILKIINEKMVVDLVDDIIREKTDDGKFERGRNTAKQAEALLEKIMDGKIMLDTTQLTSAIKFNTTDSKGNIVKKKFKDVNIEPSNTRRDRERHTVIRNS